MREGFPHRATIYYQSIQASRRGGDMHSGDRVWRERGLRDAVLAGDERAWRTLYDESFAGLYAYVLWRCGGLRDRADEAVQETWLTAVRRVRRFDPDAGSFAGWLRGIAANVLRNQFRRERVRGSTEPLRDLADDSGSLRDSARKAERIAAALSALPDRYEAVLRAKYLEGRSVADIALEVGETPKAIESLLSRARQAFRDAYGTEEDEHHA
jgi:RNA polymerase sigma-70 factor, ECF subfamily